MFCLHISEFRACVCVCTHKACVFISVCIVCMCLPVHCIGLAATNYHSGIIDHGFARLCASSVLSVCAVSM